MSTRPLCQLLVAEIQCSGPCNSLRQLHVIRDLLTLTLYPRGHGGLQKKKGHHPLVGRKVRLHNLSKALFTTAYSFKPRFLFVAG